MLEKNLLIEMLDDKNIKHKIHYHNPLFTVCDSKKLKASIEGSHTKNLFLKNKKNQFVLLSCEENEVLNLKTYTKAINLKNLSFAKPQYLYKYLGIKPGSVSPFALLNDKDNVVKFYLEEKLFKSQKINFHPLINISTITINTSDFLKFMIDNNKKINIYSNAENRVIETYE